MIEESEVHTVACTDERPILIEKEPSNLPQFEPYTATYLEPEVGRKLETCELIAGASYEHVELEKPR